MRFQNLDKVTANRQCGSTNQSRPTWPSIPYPAVFLWFLVDFRFVLIGAWRMRKQAAERQSPNNERPETLIESQDARAALPQNCSPKKIKWHPCPCLWHFRAMTAPEATSFYLPEKSSLRWIHHDIHNLPLLKSLWILPMKPVVRILPSTTHVLISRP